MPYRDKVRNEKGKTMIRYDIHTYQLCRQMGQEFFELLCCNHFDTHCKWKACPHLPQTTGQSSPGNLTPGAVPSKAVWQMPQTSSLAFQLHCATAWKRLMCTLRRLLCGCVGTTAGGAAADGAADVDVATIAGGLESSSSPSSSCCCGCCLVRIIVSLCRLREVIPFFFHSSKNSKRQASKNGVLLLLLLILLLWLRSLQRRVEATTIWKKKTAQRNAASSSPSLSSLLLSFVVASFFWISKSQENSPVFSSLVNRLRKIQRSCTFQPAFCTGDGRTTMAQLHTATRGGAAFRQKKVQTRHHSNISHTHSLILIVLLYRHATSTHAALHDVLYSSGQE
jgi:hypothetical protein